MQGKLESSVLCIYLDLKGGKEGDPCVKRDGEGDGGSY